MSMRLIGRVQDGPKRLSCSHQQTCGVKHLNWGGGTGVRVSTVAIDFSLSREGRRWTGLAGWSTRRLPDRPAR
jgi:hypothetical protein